MSKIPVTVNRCRKLRAELHRLKTVDRPECGRGHCRARSHGDLSENAEYDAAKERQGFIEGVSRKSRRNSRMPRSSIPKLLDADGRCVSAPPWKWKIRIAAIP